MKIIALRPILHGGRQYGPGDRIYDANQDEIATWLKFKSVRVAAATKLIDPAGNTGNTVNDGMTVSELRMAAAQRGINIPARASKGDMIALLTKNNQ